jgi:tRNA pseudouridine32 synthase/23S rRNA pseudouridine746 synthase
MARTVVKIDVESPRTACDLLAEKSGISKSGIKDAMNKGAVWLKDGRGGMKRLRRATAMLSRGSHIELYYDKEILAFVPLAAECIEDRVAYSVWHKPAGLMSQGTKYGDHCSLLRQAETFFIPRRQAYLVHRLDREVSGIMLIGHSPKAAAGLSALFEGNSIVKKYRAEVLGLIGRPGESGTIELPLDGKKAVTEYLIISHDHEMNTSAVEIVIRTGRLHQIRRHFDMIGHPVMGDPRYGKGNKNREGMKLTAVSLEFTCPVACKKVCFTIA